LIRNCPRFNQRTVEALLRSVCRAHEPMVSVVCRAACVQFSPARRRLSARSTAEEAGAAPGGRAAPAGRDSLWSDDKRVKLRGKTGSTISNGALNAFIPRETRCQVQRTNTFAPSCEQVLDDPGNGEPPTTAEAPGRRKVSLFLPVGGSAREARSPRSKPPQQPQSTNGQGACLKTLGPTDKGTMRKSISVGKSGRIGRWGLFGCIDGCFPNATEWCFISFAYPETMKIRSR